MIKSMSGREVNFQTIFFWSMSKNILCFPRLMFTKTRLDK